MEEEKYYTPEESEFCIGFEYDILISDISENGDSRSEDWYNNKVNCLDDIINIKYTLNNYRVRAKYLDKKDLEDFGYIITKEYTDELEAQLKINRYNFYNITYNNENLLFIEHFYQAKLIVENTGEYNSNSIFCGTIKNKLELEKLMKQCNII